MYRNLSEYIDIHFSHNFAWFSNNMYSMGIGSSKATINYGNLIWPLGSFDHRSGQITSFGHSYPHRHPSLCWNQEHRTPFTFLFLEFSCDIVLPTLLSVTFCLCTFQNLNYGTFSFLFPVQRADSRVQGWTKWNYQSSIYFLKFPSHKTPAGISGPIPLKLRRLATIQQQ